MRLVIGFPPGGAADVIARAVGNKLAASFGQQVIADNRGGHSGTVAADIVSKAAPDGYTLLHGTIALVVNAILTKNLPFDYTKDLLPVTQAVDQTNILVVHPSVPAKSVKELIALAKAKPLNGGSSGVGGTGHLALELFNLQAGTKITHIPYKGGGPAMVDLMAGHVDLLFASVLEGSGHIKAGRLKGLAVTHANRNPALPDVPTIAEAGVKGGESGSWIALLAPAGTPQPIIDRLAADVKAAVAAPEVREKLIGQGAVPQSTTPAELQKLIDADAARYGRIIRDKGVKIE